MGRKKLTFEYVKKSFEDEGYKLISTKYKHSREKLDFICPNGHKHSIQWDNWNQGLRCRRCRDDKLRLSYKDVKKSFDDEGYTLLSKNYVNSYTKLDFICPNGHEHSIAWDKWQQGRRCSWCSGKGKMTIEVARKSFEDEGYTLLSTEYKDARSKLKFICPNGHEHSTSWVCWNSGVRCAVCSSNAKFTYEDVKKSFEDEGYTLLSKKYINSKVKLDFICPNGHEHSIIWNAWQSGNRCGECYSEKIISNQEMELKEYVTSLDCDYIPNDRTIVLNQETGRYLELDLWFPDTNKAIEFNGTFWHSFPTSIKNDQIKKDFCEWKGIDLLIIEEHDWTNNRPQVEQQVKSFLDV